MGSRSPNLNSSEVMMNNLTMSEFLKFHVKMIVLVTTIWKIYGFTWVNIFFWCGRDKKVTRHTYKQVPTATYLLMITYATYLLIKRATVYWFTVWFEREVWYWTALSVEQNLNNNRSRNLNCPEPRDTYQTHTLLLSEFFNNNWSTRSLGNLKET